MTEDTTYPRCQLNDSVVFHQIRKRSELDKKSHLMHTRLDLGALESATITGKVYLFSSEEPEEALIVLGGDRYSSIKHIFSVGRHKEIRVAVIKWINIELKRLLHKPI